jgi:hypothetical protein
VVGENEEYNRKREVGRVKEKGELYEYGRKVKE